MPVELTSVIAATTRWLLRAYPPVGGPLSAALAEAQARQAVTVAAWLRYPTSLDVGLVSLLGPGGSHRLDGLVGGHPTPESAEEAWRSWVDEAVASWAACLLTEPTLADAAVVAAAGSEHDSVTAVAFRRLTAPDEGDQAAAGLLRHPDLLDQVSRLYRDELVDRLDTGLAGVSRP
ncbi:hypothetical protein LRS74_31775 [Streptomyces sp. LX-29]|uniref:hypothetical protein n=1 Tax=Streptomyces sp. LX-29 TaxID=2900152 RepID=UPI00240E0A51|nr:hypothetical protein [Streptomyces sp. LX-29]WFB11110.1 hypothetical protein LRS74_31775 [Streptomyces sp. LX-29]